MKRLEEVHLKRMLEEHYFGYDGTTIASTETSGLRAGTGGEIIHTMSFERSPREKIKSVILAIRAGRYFKGYEKLANKNPVEHFRILHNEKPLSFSLSLTTQGNGKEWIIITLEFTPGVFTCHDTLTIKIILDENLPAPVLAMQYRIPIFLMGETDRCFIEEPITFMVSGARAIRICAHTSSIIQGEKIRLRVSALDHIGNWDRHFSDILVVRLKEREVRTEMKGGLSDVDLPTPGDGMYQIAIFALSSGLSGKTNYFMVDRARKYQQLVWGDIHGHSILSDGVARLDEHYGYSRDVRFMEVAAVTDHDNQIIANGSWGYIQEKARQWSLAGEFIALPGYEWAQPYEAERNYGHKNIYFRTYDANPLFSGDIHDGTDAETPVKLYERLPAKDCVVISHHPAYKTWMWTDWEHFDPSREEVIEVYSTHGASDEMNTIKPLPNFEPERFILPNLRKNDAIKLGFVGGSDCHAGLLALDFHSDRACPDDRRGFKPYRGGLTAFWVPALTLDHLLDALVKRTVYATTGEKLLLLVEVNGHLFESKIVTTHPKTNIIISFGGSAPVRKLEIFKNNFVCHVAGELPESFRYE